MRIFVVDDNEMVRHGVVGLLSSEPDREVCGEAGDGATALQSARELLPDVLLLDIQMPGLNGLDLASRLRQDLPQIRILVMSQHDPIQLLPSVLAAGGDACIDKSRLATDLLASIKGLGCGSAGTLQDQKPR